MPHIHRGVLSEDMAAQKVVARLFAKTIFLRLDLLWTDVTTRRGGSTNAPLCMCSHTRDCQCLVSFTTCVIFAPKKGQLPDYEGGVACDSPWPYAAAAAAAIVARVLRPRNPKPVTHGSHICSLARTFDVRGYP